MGKRKSEVAGRLPTSQMKPTEVETIHDIHGEALDLFGVPQRPAYLTLSTTTDLELTPDQVSELITVLQDHLQEHQA